MKQDFMYWFRRFKQAKRSIAIPCPVFKDHQQDILKAAMVNRFVYKPTTDQFYRYVRKDP